MSPRAPAMPRRFRLSLLIRLLLMFALGGLLVLAMLLFGDRVLRDASHRLENAVINHVRPLAATHRLQTRTNTLRTLEVELPQLQDFFAVNTHLSLMEAEIDAFASEFDAFSARLATSHPDDARRLAEHWQRYRSDLEAIIALARNMDLAAVARVSGERSRGAHASISEILRELVSTTEQAAADAYAGAQDEQRRQERFFLALSLGGFVFLAGVLLVFARSLSQRLRKLRDAASALAAGQNGSAIPISGDDEIADLGVAFNVMQDKVVAREQWLRAAQEELEDRVSERTRDLAAANARLRLLSQAVEQSPIGVLIASTDRRVEYVNSAYVRVTGGPAESAITGHLPDIAAPEGRNASDPEFRSALAEGREWEGERSNRRPDGTEYWEHLRLSTVLDERGQPAHLLLMREDVTERKRQEEKVAYQAYFDALTGLPNRTLALDRLQTAASRARRENRKCALMFLDLDNFKQINDTLGHAAGDELLRQAADRLRIVVRDEDTVARLGGDEFLVILGGLASADDAEAAAAKIIQVFNPLFSIEGREFNASPSIGLSLFPDDGTEPAVLLRNADLAMYEAKEAGRNTYRFFNQNIHDESVARLEMERLLRGALERGELLLHFQPLVSSHDGTLVGAEALLRWNSPVFGRVPPDRFIPVAEQSGLIIDIGAWVIEEACARSEYWRSACNGEFVIAVNVSPRQFASPTLLNTVRECIARHRIPPRQLEIEVTEGLLIRNAAEVNAAMHALDALGVSVSLDDFGTGYSSLSYLRAFPFHTVKIDRSFVRDLSDDEGDRALVVAAIRMAHALGLRVVAEGVETDAQRRFLASHQANFLQGYLFGHPIPADQFGASWFPAAS